MARIRSIKPEFFRHAALYRAEVEARLPLRVAFAGLWTAADRDGRFRWEPESLKLDCLPYDKVDFARVLDALAQYGFIERYAADGRDYGCIPSWHRHQVVNNRESASTVPAPPATPDDAATSTRAPRVDDACPTRAPRVPDACLTRHDLVQGEGKGKEGKGREGKEECVFADASTPPPPDVVLTFPCQGAEASWSLTTAQVTAWAALYPDLDILAECRQALAYVSANGRKTSRGMPAFLVNWFNRSARMGAKRPGAAKPVNTWDSWRPSDEAAS
jgi:hypothetical protein